jgi:hypothetical protein
MQHLIPTVLLPLKTSHTQGVGELKEMLALPTDLGTGEVTHLKVIPGQKPH